MGGKTAHNVQCYKLRAWNKLIDLILDIESFEQHHVIIKELLHSDWLKQHMGTIGIDQLLSNCAMYKHRCLEDIKKLYTYARKYDAKQHFKEVL